MNRPFATAAAFRLSLTHFYNCPGGGPIAAPSKLRQEIARMWEKAQNRSFSACMSHSTRTASPAATSIVSGPCRRLAGFGHHNLWIIVGKTSGEAVILHDKLSRSEGYRSWLQNGPKTRFSVSAESRLGVRQEVGRDDADQERSQNRLAAIQRLSLNRQRNTGPHRLRLYVFRCIVVRDLPGTCIRAMPALLLAFAQPSQ